MKKLGSSLTAATALIAFCTMADRVHAQMGPYSPPISPYLNLLRTGANPGLNFYNLVLPEFQLYGAANQLNMGQNNLGQAINSGGSSLGMTTGHPVMFGPNYLWYYPRRGGMGGMGGMGMGGMGMGGMGMGGMGMGGMGMGGMGMYR